MIKPAIVATPSVVSEDMSIYRIRVGSLMISVDQFKNPEISDQITVIGPHLWNMVKMNIPKPK